ncbi:hypothetical protein LINPERHAP2_LOCUS44575 [Linum perenne]
MNRSRQNYVAPGVLNKYSKKPVSFKSFSSSSKLTKSSKLPTKRQEYPAKRQELTSDGANVQPHLLHTRGRNHNNEILQEIVAEMNEEINVEMNEEINPEIDAEMIEVVDLQIREDFLNEETLSEIGDNAKVFSRSLGIIVRTPRVVSVRMMKWNEISEKDLDFIWAVAQEYFRNANMVAQNVEPCKNSKEQVEVKLVSRICGKM